MLRIKSISIICLLFLTVVVFASFGRSQTAANNTKAAQGDNEQTMRALLNEVRQLRLAIQKSNLSAYRAQVIVERMRLQQQQVGRLTETLRDTRDRMANVKMAQTEIQNELKKIEGRLSRDNRGPDAQEEEQQETFKTRLGLMAQEEARLREIESQSAAQLQIEQARLAELDDQLDALRRELEMPPAENKQPQGGKRP
jgi:multidrug efflux pump subunit AcrB